MGFFSEVDLWRTEMKERRAAARRKENRKFIMREIRQREREMGQVCISCGHRKPLTEFDVKNICRLCIAEAKKEAPRGKSKS